MENPEGDQARAETTFPTFHHDKSIKLTFPNIRNLGRVKRIFTLKVLEQKSELELYSLSQLA